MSWAAGPASLGKTSAISGEKGHLSGRHLRPKLRGERRKHCVDRDGGLVNESGVGIAEGAGVLGPRYSWVLALLLVVGGSASVVDVPRVVIAGDHIGDAFIRR